MSEYRCVSENTENENSKEMSDEDPDQPESTQRRTLILLVLSYHGSIMFQELTNTRIFSYLKYNEIKIIMY